VNAAIEGVAARVLSLLFVLAALFHAPVAAAQCAAQASTCALCHATSDRAPERRPGAEWHRDHAVGDFCAGCHGGDARAATEDEAHRGLSHPLSDPARSCAPCHADRWAERADGYAAHLAARAPEPPPPPRAAPGSGNVAIGALAAAVAVAFTALIVFNERRRRRAPGGSA
jgi:hypothetical protein